MLVTPQEIKQVLDDALSEDTDTDDSGDGEKEEKESHAQIFIRLADVGDFFHDEDNRVYVRVAIGDHFECYPVDQSPFRLWLTNLFYQETGRAPSSEGFKQARGVLEARGMFDGDEANTFVRVAEHGGNIYLDLADRRWRAVEVTQDGWEITTNHAARFIRPQGMRPIIEPVHNDNTKAAIDLLRNHINADDDAFVLIVAWLIQAMRPTGPYPVLALTGEHGSAKTTCSNLLRRLVDPNKASVRSAPSKELDLAIACSNSWAVVFDNLSSLSGYMSDALCRVSTGGGFSTRKYYTDNEERLFDYRRPIILNGITTYIYRTDLADRPITVDLQPIELEKRREESTVYAAFERDAPKILGGLLDAVSVALANIDHVHLDILPRLADFALWIEAAEPALPWEAGRFQRVFHENREAMVESSLEGDVFANAIIEYFQPGDHFVGSAGDLLEKLSRFLGEDVVKKYKKGWPNNAHSTGRALKRIATFLRRFGFEYEYLKDSRPRKYIITRPIQNDGNDINGEK